MFGLSQRKEKGHYAEMFKRYSPDSDSPQCVHGQLPKNWYIIIHAVTFDTRWSTDITKYKETRTTHLMQQSLLQELA